MYRSTRALIITDLMDQSKNFIFYSRYSIGKSNISYFAKRFEKFLISEKLKIHPQMTDQFHVNIHLDRTLWNLEILKFATFEVKHGRIGLNQHTWAWKMCTLSQHISDDQVKTLHWIRCHNLEHSWNDVVCYVSRQGFNQMVKNDLNRPAHLFDNLNIFISK